MKKYLLNLLNCRKFLLFFPAILFSFAVFAQPSYDDCSNAKSRTSSTTCNSSTYTLNNATVSAGIPGVPCVAGVHYDVWFKFTALNTTHTATISNRGSNFTNPEVAIFSGPCGVTLVQLACGTTTATAAGLTIGTVYYVRVSNVGAAVPNNGGFDICITHPPPPPANDDCGGAVSLTSNTSCNNTSSTLRYATASAGIPGVPCVVGVHYDVWFSFTAVSLTEIATISNRGSSFTNPEVAIFSGPCGGLAQLACGTTTATATALTIGNVYYVRVSNVGAAISASTGTFDICITHPTLPPNDLCVNAILITSASACNSVTGNLRYATSVGPAGACGGAALATTFDVWYRFQATATMHSVYLKNLGSNLTAATTYTEVLSGACGALTSLSCQSAATRDTIAGLTIGNFYYVRVYVTTNPLAAATSGWNFDICIQQPPANDVCANAVNLVAGVACTTTAGTLDLATSTVLGNSGCMVAGTYYDVWYKFTATALSHTITISGAGANFTAPRIFIFAACAAPAPIACASAFTITVPTAIGTTYYVQVSNFGVNPWTTTTGATFDICNTTSVAAPPATDNCSGADVLISSTACVNTASTLINATATAGLPACGNAASPDVWFMFVAQSAYPTITLSSVGVNLTAANPRIQLFSGICGTLTSLACTASPLITGNVPVALTIGSTYYIRITTMNLAAPVAAGTYTFNICVTDPVPLLSSIFDYAKSYINVTSGTTGGTINPGDILEIRATLALVGAAKVIDSVAFYDTLKAGIGLSLLPNSLATRTNEGVIYKTFTDASADADAGFVTPVGADNAVQINIGNGATKTARGKILGTSKPSFYGGTCIIMATYRVTVTGGYGTKINFGGGAITYKDPLTGNSVKINFPTDSLMVYQSAGSCPNTLGQSNILGDEFNGTFGAPPGPTGAPQNRTASFSTNYTYAVFAANAPQDYYHGVANNTSANNTVVQTVGKPAAAGPRVFNLWDITGDHTGAANTAKGNVPCNTALPISATNPCGYMLIINSAYRTDRAFTFTVSGACPNTYYEISSWIKNICYKCGCDSNGVGAGSAGYIPSVAGAAGFGDSSGIRPNLAFQINNVDYYTTGDIPYQGLGIGATQAASDTMNNWLRKAFVYKTGIAETGFVISIRNNAPGGGGNDWAIDDISLKTCYPSMTYSPSVNPNICANGTITIRDTVRSLYNTYVEYKWQRSTNGGATWVDIAGTTATASPIVVNGMYQFITTFTVPPIWSNFTNNGDQYRVVVATTVANLASTCNFSDVIPITLIINNCIDIDDDNDGIPDYVEFNNPVALQDANANGIPNWADPTYPGFVDNNADGVNDNFDWGADADNDAIPNYLDPTFLPWVDSNADGVNDLSDKDLDGIPNQLDLDSDNDGIPDVVESYGVDTNGDGIIDNYTDTDGDGFSQNVDANNIGVVGSGNGLGAPDFDGDGIPNYLDTDSDNDGIPDLVEAGGADVNNNGKIDVYIDANFDGISDNSVLGSALLITGVDVAPVDGRADNWPNKNLDRDLRPNAYDVDSDGDGIVDVIEAGLPDANFNGIVDGVIGANGWSATVSAMPALNLLNTDGIGNYDYLDIDSDEDGIPDNIEGQSTANYKLPTLTDTDGDGLMNPYDNLPAGFSGSGIFVYDHDADGTPDYRDLDSDADGLSDRIEGNDYNLNGIPDDNVTPTGLDTDGDGLDDRYDSLNSVTNIKGTSYRMGTNGSFTGDAAPGSRTTVQRTIITQTDRDWRYSSYVLPVEFLNFTGVPQKNMVPLKWTIIASKEIDHFEIERSLDNTTYAKIGMVSDPVKINEEQNFGFTDDISGINNDIIYYRLKVIGKAGEIKYSNILIVRNKQSQTPLTMMPNPANSYVKVNLNVEKNIQGTFILIDKVGTRVLNQKENLIKGNNSITLKLDNYSEGVYALIFETAEEKIVKQLIIIR